MASRGGSTVRVVSVVPEPSPLELLLSSLDREGRGFEVLCRWFLQNDPEFRAEYEQVWLWADWPGRWGPDRGIDLLARTFAGDIVAVQVKNYSQAHTITKRDLDTFLSESNRAGVSARLLIASTDKLAHAAREVMAEQEKPVSTCLLSRMRASSVQWPASIVALAPAVPPPAMPREHQLQALDAIDIWARGTSSRAQVIMACGTGKTLVEVWAAERLGARQVLVLVPTISLLRQCAREWTRHAGTQRGVLRICSDKATAETEDIIRGDELGSARTTDPAEIAARLRADAPLLVLCTYDSSPVLAEAMQSVAGFYFDVAIADEAHRCAGLEGSKHKTILNENAVRAQRRLFFTATPTVYGTRDKSRATSKSVRLASMDDQALFGRVIYHFSFAEAIATGLLCRYQVAVIPIKDEEVHELIKRRRIVTADGDRKLEAAGLATQIACARAMRRFGCRRIVAFHPTIVESKRFSEHFPTAAGLLREDERPEGAVWSRHVDGAGMPHATRMQLLQHFQSEDTEEYRLLSNVRLLTEGVDVPGIDAIAFVDTHRGQGSIIQAVGRAVRPAPGKAVGTIVLPVVVREGESFDAALARSEHRSIVDILAALRSHDADIIKSLDDLRFNVGPDDHRPSAHGRFVVDAPLQVGEEFAAAVDVALTGALGVAAQRPSRLRSPAIAPLLIADSQPPSEEELFELGVERITSLGRWQLLTEVPPDEGDPFPLQACWAEAKQRWANGTLDKYDRMSIAQSVSWLTEDLQDPAHARQRREMARLTDADVPEQIAAQCRFGGLYAERLDALMGWQDADELIAPLGTIQPLITHAAMSPAIRLRYMLVAVSKLATAVGAAAEASGLGWWERRSWNAAAIDGFVYELQLAHAASSTLDVPNEPWGANLAPAAYLIGRRGAESLTPLARRMRIYSFPGDTEAVAGRLQDEDDMPPDERLDALGWDIYLLARARGDTSGHAFSLGMEGILRVRENVRRDLLERSLREIES
jgi:superfamily II DNA or RNA helicase